ncbi:MAG: hypothetical protein LBR77_01210 [Lachnospiraceae bacterium]|nr:hypothetical protein [Lachnospiraceae bacterium]
MGFTFDFDGLEDLRLSLPGDYQPYNAATALTAVKALQGLGWEISEAAIRKGLEEVRWPARFEVVRQGNPTFILDGGHNPQGAQMVADSLRRHFPGRQAIFIFGVMADKDYGAMADAILPLAKRIFTVTPDSPRALPAQELAHFIEGRRAKAAQPPEGAMQAAIGAGPLTGGGCAGRVPQDIEVTPCATIPAAVEAAFAAAGPGDVICAFGSLYMAGDVSDAVRAHGEALT